MFSIDAMIDALRNLTNDDLVVSSFRTALPAWQPNESTTKSRSNTMGHIMAIGFTGGTIGYLSGRGCKICARACGKSCNCTAECLMAGGVLGAAGGWAVDDYLYEHNIFKKENETDT